MLTGFFTKLKPKLTLRRDKCSFLNYDASFLNYDATAAQDIHRSRRAAPLAMMALASVGLFGSGMALGGGTCGIKGIFGCCHDKSKKNAENIPKLADFAEALREDVFKLRNEVNDKVTSELAAIKSVQKQMAEVQNRNWQLIEEHFKIFQDNIHVLRDCDQVLFSRQQINFNYDTISSLLAITFANIKSYRGTIYMYRINMMNSIQPILNHYLPMSLVPRQSLLTILKNVAAEQNRSKDRRSLAIPMDEIISYYESRLLRDVITVDQGLVMRTAIPLASKQTAFTVFRSIAVPMPQLEPDLAIKWNLEAPYLAISEDNMETAYLTEYDLSRCIGSSRYQICLDMIATETGHGSCLATLFFKGTGEALQICDTEQIALPATEIAGNLGFGVWLITSATTAYTLFESDTASTTSSGIIKYPGCSICIITLECGKQSVGPHIKIKSDLSTCEQLPAIKIKVKFPDPLKQLWIDFSTKSAAGIAMMKEVREHLIDSPKMRDSEKLLDIARLISSKMTQLRPSLSTKFDSHLSIKNSLLMSLISFLGSMVLDMLFVCIYHRYKHKHRETPLWCGLFCPKNSLVPGREEKIKRTISLSTLTDERETASNIALNAAGHGLKRTASEISMVISGSNKFPAVKQIQCPSYDTVHQEGVIYVRAPSPPSQANVMTTMAPPGQHPG